MTGHQKTVLITGSTRGIGLAFAELYKKNGWNVIATARNLDAAEKMKAIAPNKLLQLDTSDEASILKAAKELEGEPIDLLINNAGMDKNDSIETATKAALMEQFEVNAVGPFLVTRALLPNLRAAVVKNGAAVVGQMSSRLSIMDIHIPGMVGYRTSKTALNKINAILADELKKEKITAVVLHPGLVSTDKTAHNGQINTDESVAGLSKVLAGVAPEDAGKFFSYDGVNLPW